MVEISLYGTFNFSTAVARRLIAEGRPGVMCNIITTYAWTGAPGVAHSAAAKAGMLAFTKSVGREWGEHAIRVNAVAPGFVPTESATAQILSAPDAADRMRGLIPLGRFGCSEEIADAVSFLMSDQASYITSSILTVDAACRSEYQCTPPRRATTARDPVRNRVVAALPGGPHPIGSWAMIRMASARGNVRRGCGPRRRPCRQARWLAATAGTGRAGIPTGRGWCGRA